MIDDKWLFEEKVLAIIIVGLFAIILLGGCAPENKAKCTKYELLYRTYYNGNQWVYYPESTCTRYE